MTPLRPLSPRSLPSLADIQAERERRTRANPDGKKISFEAAPEWFHFKQKQFWESDKPVVAICAGWQSGKTVSLPPWLKREIQRKGPGDYGAFSSTYKLLSRKFLPELKKEFRSLCDYRAGDMQFVFTAEGSQRMWGSVWNGEPTVIQLGYAENPDSLESATMKAVVWDEPGQRLVPHQSYLTVESRLMVNRGRMALASRPYESGWYEQLVKSGESSENSKVGVISFPSWANPMNPQENDPYWDEMRAKMPTWKFTILYEGRFTQPLGLIYDCFDYERDTCDDFPVPNHWKLYPGVDFGGVNMAAVVVAENPATKELFVVHEYHAGVKRTFDAHAIDIRNKRSLSVGAGGSHQEDGWREAFKASQIFLDEPPMNDVDVQIQCVYEQIAGRNLKFFRQSCPRIIEDLGLYSREVDDDGEIKDSIADKSKWHRLDALRYIVTKLKPPRPKKRQLDIW